MVLFYATFNVTCNVRLLFIVLVVRTVKVGRFATRFVKVVVCKTIGFVMGGEVAFQWVCFGACNERLCEGTVQAV